MEIINLFAKWFIIAPSLWARVLLIVTVTGVVACEPDIFYDIPPENRPVFKSGDLFYYTSAAGTEETLETHFDQYYRNSDKRYNYEELDIAYIRVKQAAEPVVLLRVNQGTGYTGEVISTDEAMTLVEKLERYVDLNGSEFNYVYHFIYPEAGASDIKEVYYHYRFGILKYEYGDGRTMTMK
jgi:hypothetical protein